MGLLDLSEREYWAYVSERPGMFVGRPRLASLEAYVDGYVAHAIRHGGPALEGWYEWLVARRGRECNHGWNGLVRHIALPDGWESWDLPPNQESHVIKVLFELLDEFLAEQEPRHTPDSESGSAA
ncbi:hypothetical protein ACIA49_19700 [Kribbella sp. NPDC051587]|uniref:hypothetical protein n=1 Tax=Kribbella sp. NPDC051587 TaxID=3364119 RepID=UPI0037B7AAF9